MTASSGNEPIAANAVAGNAEGLKCSCFGTSVEGHGREFRIAAVSFIALFGADGILVGLLESTGRHWPKLEASLGFATAFAGIGFWTVILVWGRANIVLRTIGLVVASGLGGVVAMSATRSHWTIQDYRQWAAILTLYSVILVVPLAIARCAGLVRVDEHFLPAPDLRMRQFSVNSVLSLVTVIGILLAVITQLDLTEKYAAWRAGNLALDYAWVTCAGGILLLVVPLSASHCTTAAARSLVICSGLALIVGSIPFGVHAPWVMSFMAAPEFHHEDYTVGAKGWQVSMSIAIHAALMTAIFAAARKDGFRLGWRAFSPVAD